MNKAVEFLKTCQTFYIATAEGDQPRVRAFGAVAEINGKVCLATNNTKAVYRQMTENPKIEICGVAPDGKWIRITGKAVADDSRDVKAKMLEINPMLKTMYSLDDGIFAVVYLTDAAAKIESFAGEADSFSID